MSDKKQEEKKIVNLEKIKEFFGDHLINSRDYFLISKGTILMIISVYLFYLFGKILNVFSKYTMESFTDETRVILIIQLALFFVGGLATFFLSISNKENNSEEGEYL